MVKPRAAETDQGIQGAEIVETYDRMQRGLRDKGLLETNEVIANGLTQGLVLELGPGPGYLGLEWLKSTRGTRLKGLDISPDMVEVARRNAREYNLEDRAEYVRSSGASMPFADAAFDAAFTASSLHEWTDPKRTFAELARIIRPGGRLFVTDFRRDINLAFKSVMWWIANSKAMRAGLMTSIRASYLAAEIPALIEGAGFSSYRVKRVAMGLQILAVK
jgi:ubiquinone/menaquinone biosynthesis C-methylase UbiE